MPVIPHFSRECIYACACVLGICGVHAALHVIWSQIARGTCSLRVACTLSEATIPSHIYHPIVELEMGRICSSQYHCVYNSLIMIHAQRWN